MMLATDLPVALAIFIAAGGWGYLAIRRLLPVQSSTGLAVTTSVAAGLWLQATALLAVGSFVPGAFSAAIWWPVVGVGLLLAAWQAKTRLVRIHIPSRLSSIALLWIVPAVAAGIWLAGATVPQGFIGRVNGDFYDVVSYHLQVPREFYLAGRIAFLPHNTYSNYPLGGEMVFLLAMILKGGPWPGAYAATFTHGLWGVLTLAAIWTGLPQVSVWCRRAAAMLLFAAPIFLYVSWLAFVELSELAYLALALAWLMHWAQKRDLKSAALVGLMCGGACATKYLCVGFVALPVLAVMAAIAAARRSKGAVAQWVLASLLCVMPLAPWLVRNTINTGNPVFPLATGFLGRGYWSPEAAQRWDRAHASPQLANKPTKVRDAAKDPRGFGVALRMLAIAGFAGTLIRWRKAELLDKICLALALIQIVMWGTTTHMPTRFLIPSAVPLAILAGGLVASVIENWKFPARGRHVVGMVLLVAASALSLGQSAYALWLEPLAMGHGLPLQEVPVLAKNLPANARVLQVGDVRPFSFRPNTLYASVWEMDPLVRLARQHLSPPQILQVLKSEYGVTHIWINWLEIERIRGSYGWWDEITPAFVDGLIAAARSRLI